MPAKLIFWSSRRWKFGRVTARVRRGVCAVDTTVAVVAGVVVSVVVAVVEVFCGGGALGHPANVDTANVDTVSVDTVTTMPGTNSRPMRRS